MENHRIERETIKIERSYEMGIEQITHLLELQSKEQIRCAVWLLRKRRKIEGISVNVPEGDC